MKVGALLLAVGAGLAVYLLLARRGLQRGSGVGRLAAGTAAVRSQGESDPTRDAPPELARLGPLAGLPPAELPAWHRRRTHAAWLGGALGLVAGAATGAGGSAVVVSMLTALGGAYLGLYLPLHYLGRAARRRQAALRAALPAFLERFVLAAAAGLGVRQCLRLATRQAAGELGAVTGRMMRRLDVGADLREALAPELPGLEPGPVRLVLGALVRGETLGVALIDLAEEQARFVRQLSAYEVERRVDALPLKLTLCGIVFLFPPVFVVVLVPNLLAFLRGGW